MKWLLNCGWYYGLYCVRCGSVPGRGVGYGCIAGGECQKRGSVCGCLGTKDKMEEGGYLATSDYLQGLIAQGRTISETMEIARDVAKKLIESYIYHDDPLPSEVKKSIDHITNMQIPVNVET